MTIQEFYQWAKANNITDYTIKVQYRDNGGDYYGEDGEIRCWICDNEKEVIL